MSNKKIVKKVTKTSRKLTFDESVKHIAESQRQLTLFVEGKLKELVDKHNSLVAAHNTNDDMLKKVIGFAAGSVGEVQAKHQHDTELLQKSLMGLDNNVLALAEMMKEVCGQLRQCDVFFERLAAKAGVELNIVEDDVEKIKQEAENWFHELVGSAFERVREKRIEQEKTERARQEAELKAKEEAEKAARDKEEADKMAEGLQEAEKIDRSVFVGSGGSGSEIPEGADVFGG
jgi:hypothetical protein